MEASSLNKWLMLLLVTILPLAAEAQSFQFSTLDKPGADWTELNGITHSGFGLHSRTTIVGTYQDISGAHAFSYSGGVFTTIPNPPNSRNTEARGINNSGVIIGIYEPLSQQGPTQGVLPFRYFAGTITQPQQILCGVLGYLPNATQAFAINDQGAIVGSCGIGIDPPKCPMGCATGFYAGNLLNSGAEIPPDDLAEDARFNYISGINDSGLAVGWYTTDGGNDYAPAHGFYVTFSANGMRGTPTIVDVPNAVHTVLKGLNNSNQMVGCYDHHGFVWPRGAASPITVDYPGAVRTCVNGISDPDPLTRQIVLVGTYYLESDPIPERHGFVAVPTTIISVQ
jgi:hypothetical protein